MSSKSGGSALTPLMRQFHAIKEQHPDKILFFRMGDFYEMFGDDAVQAAPVLGIALTSRSHGAAEKIPLAGVPYHSADRYLAKLLSKGFKVVVVEQVEDPKTAKGLVKRDIVEILTPGTATIDGAEDDTRSTFLTALYGNNGHSVGMAALDLSSGMFLVDEGPADMVVERMRLLEPSEILCPSTLIDAEDSEMIFGISPGDKRVTKYEDFNFDYRTAVRDLTRHFDVSTLDGFGVGRSKQAITAAGAIFRYLQENHRDRLSHITRLSRFEESEVMTLDYSSVRNLELIRNIADNTEENSLFSIINKCHTPFGARRLQRALLHPFKVKSRIERRLTGVSELFKERDLCFRIREVTKRLPDIERFAGRLGIGKLGPRQMMGIRDGLAGAIRLKEILRDSHSPHLTQIADALPVCDDLVVTIENALVDEPPLVAAKGGMIRTGFSKRLDDLNHSIRDARTYIASLQKVERERTGITSLKVGFNKVFGYYIEVTRANSKAVPEEYIRKQTLVNAERYITPELKEKEELILAAEEKIVRLELELYDELVGTLNARIGDIVSTADLLGEIDLVSGLAELAVSRGYCRPEIFEDHRLVIQNGRHPVIESVLPPGSFVANDVDLNDESRMVILTGPNMSGKSTYLRQIGLIVILAQIGSWVPADKAQIGLVDRVFTRVGALDNLARGQSTFLVEMVETANILHNATDRSLVLLDEVGRGTSTFDGLSVAWSVVEYINEENAARTIFATHYHELTGMAEIYDHITNYQVAVKKWENKVIFLHKIIPGGCDDSYGIEVARLAGVPRATITRARQILKLLESGKFNQSELGKGVYQQRMQPSLFDPPPSEIESRIAEADIENMTPLQALQFLNQLKKDLT
ncbi:DNA mismatch repair protein MutS [bacterium]|nr:DNA mismatch repair protein MutS [bacterium]MCB2201620.1 DNA mismatch repair protein MutS [bacterium]